MSLRSGRVHILPEGEKAAANDMIHQALVARWHNNLGDRIEFAYAARLCSILNEMMNWTPERIAQGADEFIKELVSDEPNVDSTSINLSQGYCWGNIQVETPQCDAIREEPWTRWFDNIVIPLIYGDDPDKLEREAFVCMIQNLLEYSGQPLPEVDLGPNQWWLENPDSPMEAEHVLSQGMFWS